MRGGKVLGRLKEAVPTRYRAPLARVRGSLVVAAGRVSSTLFPPALPNESELFLHLGCGPVAHPRFVNVDAYPYPHVHHVRAIDDLSPFRDGSAALVYACHCLEHFCTAEIPRVLGEWYRVLRPGGILRLSVPDFDRLVAIYAAHDRDIESISLPLLGGQDNRYNFHHAVFTAKSLTRLLQECDFREVRAWEPGSYDLTTFDDWSSRKVSFKGIEHPVSLNLEAVK